MLNSGVGRLNPRVSQSKWAPPAASQHSPMVRATAPSRVIGSPV